MQAISYAVMFLWGVIVKYHPSFKALPNVLIPYLNAVIALLMNLVGAQPAHAATGPILVLGGGFLASALHWAAPVLNAAWASAQTSLIYKVFGETALEGGLKLKVPV